MSYYDGTLEGKPDIPHNDYYYKVKREDGMPLHLTAYQMSEKAKAAPIGANLKLNYSAGSTSGGYWANLKGEA